MITIHYAGQPDGQIQRCSRCGYILTDYRNAAGVGEWHPSWWKGPVIVEDGNPKQTVAMEYASKDQIFNAEYCVSEVVQ